jgi:hypothetical protein
MAHESGSFDYKTIDENIKKILDLRSELNNSVQVGMPFVKATTTIRGNKEYLNSEDNRGFTLGLHGINEDVRYQDMFSSENGTEPLIGYTYKSNGGVERVYARDPQSSAYVTAGQILDTRTSIVTYPENSQFIRIPPPGITSVSVGRNKSGLLAMATLQISIPSLIQLESLHRTFLIPGVGMILEWGQQFAPYSTNDQYGQKSDITEHMFPWYDRDKLETMFTRLAKREVGLKEILENYVYPSNGQYMWMFGRIGTFDIKSNSDGSFTSTVKIVGPSEDSWAYMTKNTVVPRKDASSQYFCESDTNSVYKYFANTMAGGKNLKSLLDDVKSGDNKELSDWREHVISFEQANQSDGEPTENSPNPSHDEKTFADNQDAYFMTWRFFVNVVINDPKYGVRSIFTQAGLSPDLVKSIGLLLPYAIGEKRDTKIGKIKAVDDLKESFVGANKYLRSTDLSIMVIVNEMAAELAKNNPQYNIPVSEESLLDPTGDSAKFTIPTVSFEKSATDYIKDVKNPDRGLLSSGVWINHKAVVSSMLRGDTILRGIGYLLDLMNQATANYWQLTLDIADAEEDRNPHSYTVVDANFRDSSNNAVKKFLDKVYTFNKYVRQTDSGKLVGSELIDCTIDLSLPKRLFAQIGTTGLLSPEEISKIQQKEVKVGDSPPQETEDAFSSPRVSDPNNTLAEMFGIVTLSVKDGKSPDLTILPQTVSSNSKGVCGKSNAQLVAGTGGQGYQVADINPLEAMSTLPDERKKAFDASKTAVSSSACKECAPCLAAEEAQLINQSLNVPNGIAITSENMPGFDAIIFSGGSRNGREVSIPLLVDVNTAFREIGVKAVVSSAHRDMSQPESESNLNSRHLKGLAVDISAVYQGDKQLAAIGPGLSLISAAVGYLTTRLGYQVVTREQGTNTPKAIIWQSEGHYNHMHISLATSGVPIAGPTPTPTPANTEDLKTCKDSDYAKIGDGDSKKGRELCTRCKKHQQVVDQITKTSQTSVDAAVRKFSGFRKVFRYLEIFPEMMVASITANANGDNSNAFGASPGSLSISGDLTMPGINGLRVGELFWIDRVPAFYKVFGAFQVMSIEDIIGGDGWKTRINARFNYLGTAWKKSMFEILGVDNK